MEHQSGFGHATKAMTAEVLFIAYRQSWLSYQRSPSSTVGPQSSVGWGFISFLCSDTVKRLRVINAICLGNSKICHLWHTHSEIISIRIFQVVSQQYHSEVAYKPIGQPVKPPATFVWKNITGHGVSPAVRSRFIGWIIKAIAVSFTFTRNWMGSSHHLLFAPNKSRIYLLPFFPKCTM